MSRDSRVESVSPDITSKVKNSSNPAPKTVEADKDPVRAGDGVTTPWSGPAVAVVDSGVNAHPDYNLVGAVGCVAGDDDQDGNGHGTGVSGFMAAYETNAVGMVGTAPGAPIYSVRVMDDKNVGTLSSIICGLDWVAQNALRYNIKVVEHELLGARGADDGNCGFSNNDALHQAVCDLVGRGLVVVAAAGNANPGRDLALAVPASYDEVITATNVADFDGRPGRLGTAPCSNPWQDDRPATTSNYAVSAADKAHAVRRASALPLYTTLKGNRYGYIQPGAGQGAIFQADYERGRTQLLRTRRERGQVACGCALPGLRAGRGSGP